LGRLSHTLLSAVLLAGTLVTGAAADDHDQAFRLREAGEILPLQQILDKLDRNGVQRVLAVELEHEDDRYVYELEVLNDHGEVWEHRYDARSGELLNIKPEE